MWWTYQSIDKMADISVSRDSWTWMYGDWSSVKKNGPLYRSECHVTDQLIAIYRSIDSCMWLCMVTATAWPESIIYVTYSNTRCEDDCIIGAVGLYYWDSTQSLMLVDWTRVGFTMCRTCTPSVLHDAFQLYLPSQIELERSVHHYYTQLILYCYRTDARAWYSPCVW